MQKKTAMQMSFDCAAPQGLWNIVAAAAAVNVTAAAAATATDKMTKYHLQDCADRIKKALDPK